MRKMGWAGLSSLNSLYNLQKLFMSMNHFIKENCVLDEKGCMELAKGKWPNLQYLQISIFGIYQILIESEIKAANIYQKPIGQTSPSYSFVKSF